MTKSLNFRAKIWSLDTSFDFTKKNWFVQTFENVKGFVNVIVNVAFYDKEGTEIGNCRAFNSVTRYVQFVSYNFSEPDTEGDKDVEKGEENDSKDENEEEEGFLEKWMPECLKRNIPRILLVLVVTWGLTSDTLLSVWDVVSDYILAAKHFR